ncbi:MAG: hypothetical protein SGJ18_07000 [Pseudomonadota bacterium]|mgnify:CR=1 FL=1|nr:hypothetical protein [Pseudomonadota bacterium]
MSPEEAAYSEYVKRVQELNQATYSQIKKKNTDRHRLDPKLQMRLNNLFEELSDIKLIGCAQRIEALSASEPLGGQFMLRNGQSTIIEGDKTTVFSGTAKMVASKNMGLCNTSPAKRVDGLINGFTSTLPNPDLYKDMKADGVPAMKQRFKHHRETLESCRAEFGEQFNKVATLYPFTSDMVIPTENPSDHDGKLTR